MIPTTHESCKEDAAYQTAYRYWRHREGIPITDKLTPHDLSEIATVVEHFRPVFRRKAELFAGLKRAVESLENAELTGSIIKQANRVLRKEVIDEP